ncbi:unnamed protein product [Paramecium sonneborni]|uniref:Uncharacterized protein n=1 Tax=Paramecium sonneborni TaxID=65129 RepID=A0A8S1PSR4_9CILI|nr:unnamed protein product [Paramecium sonneborni]
MNTHPDTARFGAQQIDFQMLKGRSSIPSLKQQLQMQNEDNQFQITNSEKLNKKKQSNIRLEKTEFILIQEDQVKDQNQHSQQDTNYKCAQSSHQEPIMLVVLDSNLKHSERLLCSKCIDNLETNSKTLGLQKAMVQIQDIYEKKREFRDIICYKDCIELGELKNNFIKLKSLLNITLDEMIDNTEMQIRDLENYKSQGYIFDHEIDWLIKYEQKVEMDYIVEEIKPLNTRFIKKLQKKLEQFSQFAEYSSCQKILKNLMHENISEEKDKDKQQNKKKNLHNSNLQRNMNQEKWQSNCKRY